MKKEILNKNTVFELLLGIMISFLILVFGNSIIILLYPVPFIVIGIKHGLYYNIISMLISLTIYALAQSPISSIQLLVVFLPMTIAMVYNIKKRRKASQVILISTLVLLPSIIVGLGFIPELLGNSLLNQLETMLAETVRTQLESFSEHNLTNLQFINIRNAWERAAELVILTIPAFTLILCLIVAYVNYIISFSVLRRIGYGLFSVAKLSRFRLPTNIVGGILIMVFATYLIKDLEFVYYDTIILNLILLGVFVFFVQGLGVFDFLLTKRKMGGLGRFLLMFITIIFLSPISLFMFPVVGVLDLLFDFRKIKKA